MKNILFYLIFILIMACQNDGHKVVLNNENGKFHQNKTDVQNEINGDTCGIIVRRIDSCSEYSWKSKNYKFELYKDLNLVESLITNNDYSVIFGGLYSGEYILKYTDKQKGITIKDLYLLPKKFNWDSLCFSSVKEFDEEIVPFISQLDNGEVFTLVYHTTGCFHSEKAKFHIYKDNEHYFLEIGKRKILLDTEQVQTFENFEKELIQRSFEGGCTTQDDYVLLFKNQRIKITDGSCDWDGYDNLIQSLNINN